MRDWTIAQAVGDAGRHEIILQVHRPDRTCWILDFGSLYMVWTLGISMVLAAYVLVMIKFV